MYNNQPFMDVGIGLQFVWRSKVVIKMFPPSYVEQIGSDMFHIR
jgi:hypothetical protein